MNINITSVIDDEEITNNYYKMSAQLIIDEINRLSIEGYRILSIIDIDKENK